MSKPKGKSKKRSIAADTRPAASPASAPAAIAPSPADGAADARAPRTEGERQLRALPGSLADLAAKLGVKRQSVHSWKRGDKIPGPDGRVAIEAAFGIPVAAWSAAPGTRLADPAPRAGPAAAPAPALSATAGLPAAVTRSTLEDCLITIAAIRKAAEVAKMPGEIARLRDAETKALALRARLEREQELVEDRIVREHPAWRRLRAVFLKFVERHPESAREFAEELARAETGT